MMHISSKNPCVVYVNGVGIIVVNYLKCLKGVIVSYDLSWRGRMDAMCMKTCHVFYAILLSF